MTKPQFSADFNKALVAKLAKHFAEFQRNEQNAWEMISSEIGEEGENAEQPRWQELRRYFKTSLVFKLSKYTKDQQLVDQLQYPYLRKVYSVVIKFVDKGPEKSLAENVVENALFIRSVIDGLYDPAVVAAYKRHRQRKTRVHVCINVGDPRYMLSEDQRNLLMQIEKNKTRKRSTRGRQLEAGTWYDAASGVPATIEHAASPTRKMNGSVRNLLDNETLNINTQEYDQLIKDSLKTEIPSTSKSVRFAVDSDSCTESDLVSSECDLVSSECEEDIVFVNPDDVSKVISTIDVSLDPLQVANSEVTASSEPGTADGQKDTSQPLFMPSSGESAKTNQTGEPEKTAPQLASVPVVHSAPNNCMFRWPSFCDSEDSDIDDSDGDSPVTVAVSATEIRSGSAALTASDDQPIPNKPHAIAKSGSDANDNRPVVVVGRTGAPPVPSSDAAHLAPVEVVQPPKGSNNDAESLLNGGPPSSAPSDGPVPSNSQSPGSSDSVSVTRPEIRPGSTTSDEVRVVDEEPIPNKPRAFAESGSDANGNRPAGDPPVPSSDAAQLAPVEVVQPQNVKTIAAEIPSYGTPPSSAPISNSQFRWPDFSDDSASSSDSDSDATEVVVQPQQRNASSVGNHSHTTSICSKEESAANASRQTVGELTVAEEQIVPPSEPDKVELPKVPSITAVDEPERRLTVPHRWAAHYRTLAPVISSHVALYGILRQRLPQLFLRSPTSFFSDLNCLNGAISSTLFNAHKPATIDQLVQMRAMVDVLAIRIAHGVTPQELNRGQLEANPRRRVLAESLSDVELPALKRIEISETGFGSFSVQSNSPVTICLFDPRQKRKIRICHK